ncbi:MAG TPA: glycosyltransferase [Thermoanaerobaculia bacterium]|nr:glycosyltransferase [Thermoanaerobaculia bacterium]
MDPSGDCSIVIPFHSNARLLELSLATIAATVPDGVEILLVFNNSDASALPANVDTRRIRILDLGRSAGYAHAANAGAAAATRHRLIFSDADTFYAPGWFERLTSFHASTKGIGVASPKLLDPKTGRVADFGIAFTRYNAPHPQMDVFAEHATVQAHRRVQAACSACMIVDAGLFQAAGGFDPDLHNFYTDLDFCIRLNERGFENWVVADAIAYHRGSSAQTHRDAYKADVKAVFAAKNGPHITIDMPEYFRSEIRHFRISHDAPGPYVLIDLSTVVDRGWHHELLRELLPIVSVYEYALPTRDASSISLIEHLGVSILDFRTPLLYFVDRFVALRTNVMWHSLRNANGDLVVDRNGNIATLAEIVRGQR